MPANSSHILQPLDVAYFGILKKAYSTQIESLVQARISHITKEDFLPAFFEALKNSMAESNVHAGFKKAGLNIFNGEVVISKQELKLQTPTSSLPPTRENLPWALKEPNNPTEATSQSKFIKSQIARLQNSSTTSIYYAIDQFAKGTPGIMHRGWPSSKPKVLSYERQISS